MLTSNPAMLKKDGVAEYNNSQSQSFFGIFQVEKWCFVIISSPSKLQQPTGQVSELLLLLSQEGMDLAVAAWP